MGDQAEVGRTPWSARVPPDPLLLLWSINTYYMGQGVRRGMGDQGVARGPGGPPH